MRQSFTKADGLANHYEQAAEAVGGLAWACFSAGKAEEASRLLRVAASLTEPDGPTGDLRRSRLRLLLQRAKIGAAEYLLTNSGAAALFATIADCRSLAEQLEDRRSLADALALLGIAHYSATLNTSITVNDPHGNYGEALDRQREALALREELGDTRGVSESLFQIGAVCERLTQNERALEHYSRAAEIAERDGHLAEKAEPERHFAFHALLKGETEEAFVHAVRALAFREAAGFKPYMPLDHLMLADIYLRREDRERAWIHAETGYAMAAEMGYDRLTASALLCRGDIRLARGEAGEAEADYSRAMELLRPLSLPAMEARAKDKLKRLAGN